MSILKSLTVLSEVIRVPSISKVNWSFILEFLFTIIAWNLSGFTITSFCLNQPVVIWFSFSRVCNIFSIDNSTAEIISLAKLSSFEFFYLVK